MKFLSPGVIESILKYSGFIGVILLFLYLVFKNTIDKRFFTTLTQRRKTFIIITSLFSIWSIGVLVIVLSFTNANVNNKERKSDFIYSGQIVNQDGTPISNAYAYVVLGKDTIKAETPTGVDGTFVIKLDTTEGIKATVYYGHANYGMDTRFRSLTQSVPEQFFLKKSKEVTFSTNIANPSLNSAIGKQTGLKYSFLSPTFRVNVFYDKAGLDSFNGRYRYTGGKVQIYGNNTLCCESKQLISATHSVGVSKAILEYQLHQAVTDIVNKEKEQLTKMIAKCVEIHSY